MHSIASGTPSQLASFEHDISALLDNLTSLHEMARSFPVGVTLPVDKRTAFDTLFDTVTAPFEHVAHQMVTAGVPVETVLC